MRNVPFPDGWVQVAKDWKVYAGSLKGTEDNDSSEETPCNPNEHKYFLNFSPLTTF